MVHKNLKLVLKIIKTPEYAKNVKNTDNELKNLKNPQ